MPCTNGRLSKIRGICILNRYIRENMPQDSFPTIFLNRLLRVSAITVKYKIWLLANTLSGRIRNVVALHADGCMVDSQLSLHWFTLCTRRSGITAHEGGEWDQSIGSTVSDAMVRSWLWSTATRSSQLGCFRRLLQVFDNWPHLLR